MTTPINITPEAPTDGIVYGTSVPLTSTEAVLGDASQVPTVIPIMEGQTIVAVVKLTVNGQVVGSNSYVVLQTDLNSDGTWIDVAWIVWTGGQGTATFVLCGGGLGAMNNAFAQARAAGQFPASISSNAVPLGGRVRFVGKATAVGGSSSVSGTTAGLLATITYKIQNPR